MKRSGLYALLFSFVCCMLCKVPYTQQTYIASTPADPQVRTFLQISQQDSIDFIRWELRFIDQDSFVAKANYGIGKPNTMGFIQGGRNATITGSVTKIDNGHKLITGNNASLSLITINENLLHVMSDDKSLLAGNDGWNYTFSNLSSAKNNQVLNVPLFTSGDRIAGVYAGRTLCTELTKEYDLKAPADCLKLKWLLTLNRDKKTNEPTSFTLNYTLHRASIIEGTWMIDNDNVLKLYNKGNEFLRLMAVDHDVLFFVDKQNRLFNGDENFSYAINRR
jgi:hypothetical protein